jgi:hypothetical protein
MLFQRQQRGRRISNFGIGRRPHLPPRYAGPDETFLVVISVLGQGGAIPNIEIVWTPYGKVEIG